jgi:hypothetical protein
MQKPRFMPKQLIEISDYQGKPRDDVGEVYKVAWSESSNCWIIYVRCFTPEGQPPKFRNFMEPLLEGI